MGYKWTLTLTRDNVIKEIISRLDDATDESLCNALEALVEDDDHSSSKYNSLALHNFIIGDNK